MKSHKSQFKKQFPQILFDEDLSKYCTFRVGGKADYFYKLKDTEELPALIEFAKKHKIPCYLMGRGSNILFDDRGFRGLIIHNESTGISIDGEKVKAASGVVVSLLILETLKADLAGLERWIGLPGTVGGAVRGNAGCNGLETKDILVEATILTPRSHKISKVKPKYFDFDYRYSKIKKNAAIVLDATFKLAKNTLSPAERTALITEINKFRTEKQPTGSSSGSFFKNPSPEKPAGFLIDKANLKGTQIGGAQISLKHGNFFMNTGKATAADIKKLARLARRVVKAKFGITLQEEVQILSPSGRARL